MQTEKPVTYKELENIYTACMSRVIAASCEKAWGNRPEGAFGRFVELDRQKTDETNAKRDSERQEAEARWRAEREANPEKKRKKPNEAAFAHVPMISTKCDSFAQFDFQACNNTILYLDKVTDKIYRHYHLNPSQQDTLRRTVQELARLRNKLAHLSSDASPEQVAEYEQNCVNVINFTFTLGFSSVADEDGQVYYERFQKRYLQYMDQQLQRWYYLSDHLDLTLYDASRFLEVCANNNVEAAKRDGKYLFRTAHLEKTLLLLQNELSTRRDDRFPIAPPTAEPPQPNGRKKFYGLLGGLAAAAVLIGGLAVVWPLLNGRSGGDGGDTPASTTTSPSSAASTTTTTAGELPATTTSAVPSVGNEIPAKHQNAVTAFKYNSEQAQTNLTMTVAVGEYAAPPLLVTWGNATLYSENTAVAIGEGMLVKGVSPGTTYLLAVSDYGSTLVYRIIVQ